MLKAYFGRRFTREEREVVREESAQKLEDAKFDILLLKLKDFI